MPRDARIHRGLTSGWTAGEMGPTVGHLCATIHRAAVVHGLAIAEMVGIAARPRRCLSESIRWRAAAGFFGFPLRLASQLQSTSSLYVGITLASAKPRSESGEFSVEAGRHASGWISPSSGGEASRVDARQLKEIEIRRVVAPDTPLVDVEVGLRGASLELA
jgi:hypothetical protein